MLFGVAHSTASSCCSSSWPRSTDRISSSSGHRMIDRTASVSPSSWATTTTSSAASRFSASMSALPAAASSISASSMFPVWLVLRGGGGGAVANKLLKKPSSLRRNAAAAAAVRGKKAPTATSSSKAALLNDRSGNGAGNALSRWWFGHIPQLVRFVVSGNIGTLCFYACERFMYRIVFHSDNVISLFPDYEALLHSYKDSASFLTGYLLHIVAQHYLHALLVYGRASIDTPRKYWTTLFGMYQALMFAAFGSTFLNAALLPYMHRTAAFVATLCVFACINYVWIGRIVSKAAAASSTESMEHGKNKKKRDKKNATALTKNKKATTSSASSTSSMRGRSLRGGALQSLSPSPSSASCHQQDDRLL
jgi:hypothetical protein